MTRIVSGEAVGQWVAEQMKASFDPYGATAIGLERQGRIQAGIMFENYAVRSLVCHMAIRGRLNKEFLYGIADYVFNQLRVGKLIAPVDTGNERMMRLAVNFGFEWEATIAHAGRLGDIAIFTMTRDDCRFLNPRYCTSMEVLHGQA